MNFLVDGRIVRIVDGKQRTVHRASALKDMVEDSRMIVSMDELLGDHGLAYVAVCMEEARKIGPEDKPVQLIMQSSSGRNLSTVLPNLSEVEKALTFAAEKAMEL